MTGRERGEAKEEEGGQGGGESEILTFVKATDFQKERGTIGVKKWVKVVGSG